MWRSSYLPTGGWALATYKYKAATRTTVQRVRTNFTTQLDVAKEVSAPLLSGHRSLLDTSVATITQLGIRRSTNKWIWTVHAYASRVSPLEVCSIADMDSGEGSITLKSALSACLANFLVFDRDFAGGQTWTGVVEDHPLLHNGALAPLRSTD